MPASSRFTCAPAPERASKRRPLLCDHIDATIRQHIPANEIVTIVDNIGLPYSGLNLSYSTSAPIGPADADIQVQLTEDHHPTDAYVEQLRTALARQYPGVTFYVLPVDIVTQILNFGLSAPIDIQIVGPNLYGNRALAERMLERSALCSRRGRRAHSAALRLSQHDGECGPHPRPDHRPDAAECGAEHAGRAQRQLPDHAQLLSRPAERRQLQHRHPGAAIPPRFPGRAQEPAGHRLHRAAQCTTPAQPPTADAAATAASRRARARAGAGQPGHHCARHGTGHGQPLRRAAGARYLRQRGWNRPGHRDPRHGEDHRRPREGPAARLALHPARPERDHAASPTSDCSAAWPFPSCWSTC